MEEKNLTPKAQTASMVDLKAIKKEVSLAITNKTIADSLLASIETLSQQGQLIFPEKYAVGNELKLMYSAISQTGVLAEVTAESVGYSLVEALLQGLEYEKHQVYFIKRGKKLTMFRSYYGDQKVAKETNLVKETFSRPIYEDDTYDMVENPDTRLMEIKNHKTNLANMDKEIVGGYAWADMKDGSRRYCIMTRNEIEKAWAKSSDPSRNVQKDFPQEMTKRTTTRRLVKSIFNTAPTNLSAQANSIIASYNRTTAEEYDNEEPKKETKSSVKNVVCDENGVPVEE